MIRKISMFWIKISSSSFFFLGLHSTLEFVVAFRKCSKNVHTKTEILEEAILEIFLKMLWRADIFESLIWSGYTAIFHLSKFFFQEKKTGFLRFVIAKKMFFRNAHKLLSARMNRDGNWAQVIGIFNDVVLAISHHFLFFI